MPRTGTPGITLNAMGHHVIDKEYRGIRIFRRLGSMPEEHAERCLRVEIERVEMELQARANARPRFADCAARYLLDSRQKRRVADSAMHVRLLLPYIGDLEAKRVHDGTLKRFVEDRLAAGVSPTTVNRSLEVVRTILNRAARRYRDDEGRPWLDAVPPLLTMLPEQRRLPYPITVGGTRPPLSAAAVASR